MSEENSILKTTGFTRFEYKLKPKEELEFFVMEEAQTSMTKMPYLRKGNAHQYRSTTRASHLSFLVSDCKLLLEKGMMTDAQFKQLKAAADKAYLRYAMGKTKAHAERVAEQASRCALSSGSTVFASSKEINNLCKDAGVANTDDLKYLNDAIVKLQETAETLQTQEALIKEAFKNQERLRQNIKSLEKVKNQSLIDRCE